MIELDFSHLTVVVVGGTSGINRGIAEGFAEQGARVAVASRSQDKVDDTVAALKTLGAADSMGFSADVRDYEAIEQGLKKVFDAYGHFDVLISGAAGNFPALATQMSPNAFKSVVDIDLLGSYHVLRASFDLLKKPGARVINISAPQSTVPIPMQSHVSAAKAGVDMLTRSLSIEWGSSGVLVNAIVPGPIDNTEGMQRLAPTDAMREAVRRSVPLQRLGAASDIANACLFLASPLADYISGVVMPVDGGWVQGGVAMLANSPPPTKKK